MGSKHQMGERTEEEHHTIYIEKEHMDKHADMQECMEKVEVRRSIDCRSFSGRRRRIDVRIFIGRKSIDI